MTRRNSTRTFKRLFILLSILSSLLLVAVGLALFFNTTRHTSVNTTIYSRVPHAPAPFMPLISRNAPAFSNNDCSGVYPASRANDNSYDTTWKDCQTPSKNAPDWIAYDLSKVPASQRGNVLLVWYNPTGNYDHTIINNPAYNNIRDYTIDVNAAPGGGQPPTSGWITRVTVTGNHLHSRDAVFDVTGYNWVRLNITAPDGTPGNNGVSLNMDVHNASQGTDDGWIFYGASIFAESMNQNTIGGVSAFQQLISTQVPTHYPQAQGGAIGGFTSGDGANYVPQWLPLFHGKYVGLGYGTNDALACTDPTTFYNNYVTMVQAILRSGKIPLIQTILWGTNANVQNCAPPLNAKIQQLYTNYPRIIPGPNAWTYFQNNPNLIGSDGIHPNDQGAGALRQLWANTALASVYGLAKTRPRATNTSTPASISAS